MGFIGGDLIEIAATNSDIGGTKVFFPKAGEDSTFDPGGIRTNDDKSGTTSQGQGIYIKNNSRWEMNAVIGWDANTNKELEALEALQKSTQETDWLFTFSNGAQYSAKGMPVGDLAGNLNQATIAFKAQGSALSVKKTV